MADNVVSIFDHPKMKKPVTKTPDQLLERFMIVCLYGSHEEAALARADYYAALFGAADGDKPCDT